MDGRVGTMSLPAWFWAIAFLGLAWNLFGVVQFVGQVGQSGAALMGSDMTAEQAAAYSALPLWMDIAFGVGTVGGVIGSLLLLTLKKLSVPTFAASMIAYIVLFFGDISNGIFAAFGLSQVIILSTVVAIAIGLFWFARQSLKNDWLN